MGDSGCPPISQHQAVLLLLILPYKEQISREEDNNPIEAQEANISPYISTTVTPTEGVLTDLQGVIRC